MRIHFNGTISTVLHINKPLRPLARNKGLKPVTAIIKGPKGHTSNGLKDLNPDGHKSLIQMGQKTWSFEFGPKIQSKLRYNRRKRSLATPETCQKQHQHKRERHEEPTTADQPLQKGTSHQQVHVCKKTPRQEGCREIHPTKDQRNEIISNNKKITKHATKEPQRRPAKTQDHNKPHKTTQIEHKKGRHVRFVPTRGHAWIPTHHRTSSERVWRSALELRSFVVLCVATKKPLTRWDLAMKGYKMQEQRTSITEGRRGRTAKGAGG